MKQKILFFTLIFSGTFGTTTSFAASCCGGGSAASLILPKYATVMVDASFAIENYDGYWNVDGEQKPDPEGASLKQYRFNTGFAYRLASNWQISAVLPYVWNDNNYSGINTQTNGLGDTKISVLYEAFDGATCIWKIRKWQDLKPATYFGLDLTVPSGISPFDNVTNNFDITGRGFYRLDGTLLFEKTIYPWNMSLLLSYGKYLERSVNSEFGKFVEPYKKNLGDRLLSSFSFGRTQTLGSMDTLTYIFSLSHLQENEGTLDGGTDKTTSFMKRSLGLSVAYATMDRDWVVKAGFNHSIKGSYSMGIFPDITGLSMGRNFPITNVFTIGVSHVLR